MLQAQNDILLAKSALENKFFSQVCFFSQQAGEKALKALGYSKSNSLIEGHSLKILLEEFSINGELLEAGKTLNQYYITTRYPGSVSAGAPFEYFTEKQAKEAVDMANAILERVLSFWR